VWHFYHTFVAKMQHFQVQSGSHGKSVAVFCRSREKFLEIAFVARLTSGSGGFTAWIVAVAAVEKAS